MKKPIQNVDRPLTPKERLFVDEYLVDLNASAACKRAGYKTKAANVMGASLLTKINISKAVQIAMLQRAERTQITVDSVLTDIAAIKDNATRMDDNGDMVDRPSALKSCELLGRHLKMFTDKTEHNFNINMIGNFQIALVNPSITVNNADKAS